MKILKTLAACCASLLLFTGCASTTQFVPLPDQSRPFEDASKGRIYVMRPATIGGAVSMSVSDTGKPIGMTGPHGYLCWERPPGEATISSTSEGVSSVPLSVEAGKAYYIFQHLRMGILIAQNELEWVTDEAKAAKVLKKCRPPTVNRAKAPRSALAK